MTLEQACLVGFLQLPSRPMIHTVEVSCTFAVGVALTGKPRRFEADDASLPRPTHGIELLRRRDERIAYGNVAVGDVGTKKALIVALGRDVAENQSHGKKAPLAVR